MIRLIAAALALITSTSPAHANAVPGSPDKIGNGGGLWACYSPAGELQSGVLVDFFEAENEFDRKLVTPTRQDPLQAVEEIGATLQERFPDLYAGWSRTLASVKSRFHLLNGELAVIEDSLWRSRPLPSLCRTGWQYVQFANYNDTIATVQVRRDLWESPLVSTLDKAGLVWHEVIYRWMREEFGDQSSVRARQIVGILFAKMAAEEARRALEEVLKQGQTEPHPGEPVFVCMMANGISHRYYLDYGRSELAARSQTLSTCQQAEAGFSFHCDQVEERCDSFASQKQSFTCSVANGVSHKVFTQTGRSPLEAEARARRACGEAEFNAHCEREAQCSR